MNNPVLKVLCKFQVDIPINARVTAVQSSGKSPDIYIVAAMLAGKRMPIFPYKTIENSPSSLAYNSVFVGPNNPKFGTNTHCIVL